MWKSGFKGAERHRQRQSLPGPDNNVYCEGQITASGGIVAHARYGHKVRDACGAEGGHGLPHVQRNSREAKTGQILTGCARELETHARDMELNQRTGGHGERL